MSSEPMDVSRPDDWGAERVEWIESMGYVLEHYGREAAQELLGDLHRFLVHRRAAPPPALNPPYRNTISVDEQPP